jgi:hypothetical protein
VRACAKCSTVCRPKPYPPPLSYLQPPVMASMAVIQPPIDFAALLREERARARAATVLQPTTRATGLAKGGLEATGVTHEGEKGKTHGAQDTRPSAGVAEIGALAIGAIPAIEFNAMLTEARRSNASSKSVVSAAGTKGAGAGASMASATPATRTQCEDTRTGHPVVRGVNYEAGKIERHAERCGALSPSNSQHALATTLSTDSVC